MIRRNAAVFLSLLITACAVNAPGDHSAEPGSRVQVIQESDGTFTLLRNGAPYLVKGAGFGSGSLELLAASGGNSIRTWGIEHLEQEFNGKPLLDRAHELGISVLAGFWVQHARHGFDYSNPDSIAKQRDRLRDAVLKYREHPALLAWGLGNEMEGFGPGKVDVRIWQELNHLAGIVKELDPHHPVVTTIAGGGEEKIAGILKHYPNIDILGVNAYGNAPVVGKNLPNLGWKGPYMLTEFGVSGTWEVASTPWDAPVEPDPSSKATETYVAYTMDRDDNVGRSLGSYVFLWGHKQEATATWFGMFLPSGEKLPRVDAMAYAWSGEWPANRAPKIRSLSMPVAHKQVQSGMVTHAKVDCMDREGDPLRYVWDIREESSDRKTGGDAEAAPPSLPGAIIEGQGTPRITFVVPAKPGAYRVYVTAYDGQGGAVAHNLPFFAGK